MRRRTIISWDIETQKLPAAKNIQLIRIMAKYVAAIDQGTTSTRCMIFNHAGESVAIHQLEHEQIYPKPGWVEHDPLEIWGRTQEVIKVALQKAGASESRDIAAVGITNQRETALVWDRKTGKPYHNAIVWQDTRTDKICNELTKDGGQDRFRHRSACPWRPTFRDRRSNGCWRTSDGLRAAAERGDAIFGNTDTWVIWNLTGGTDGGAHVTDVSNASRTMLMDLAGTKWDDEILKIMAVPSSMLPEIRPPAIRSSMGIPFG